MLAVLIVPFLLVSRKYASQKQTVVLSSDSLFLINIRFFNAILNYVLCMSLHFHKAQMKKFYCISVYLFDYVTYTTPFN